MDGDRTKRDPTNCKVGRLIEEYGLEGLEAALADRWTAPESERLSLRELATNFNHRLLEVFFEDADAAYIEGEIDNTYRLLTDENVSPGVRIEVENELVREGIDIESLQAAFVSHQAIHTYLTKYRGISQEARDTSNVERRLTERERILRLQSRTRAVSVDSIERLANNQLLDIGESTVLVDIRVLCEDCGMDYPIGDLLQEGSCNCPT